MSDNERINDRKLVIGAGIVGTSVAYHLARRGADVVVVDRAGPAAGATGKSFAWINAHHFRRADYHRLRYQSVAEYHRLDRELEGTLGLDWCGALSFDALGDAFDQRLRGFRQLGYPAEAVSHNRFCELEPHYGHPPGRALYLPLEAAVEPVTTCRALVDAAVDKGARTMFGSDVAGLRQERGRIVGVDTCYGPIDAGQVVVAAGVGAEAILKSVDVDLPMANRFGVMLISRPVESMINHIIWGDRIHMKQQEDGRLVIGEIFSENWPERHPDAIAEQMLDDARRHLPDIDLTMEHMTIGLRPIPEDGMPVVGAVAGVEGLYVAVMHSGITLAPIVGRMVAEEMLDGVRFDILDPYRLSRFRTPNARATSS